MNEPKSFCVAESIYYPVWIEPDGFEWHHEPVWEGCEYGHEPFDPDKFDPIKAREELLRAPSETDCPRRVEYMGERGQIHIQLCGEHFEAIKRRSIASWALWLGMLWVFFGVLVVC